MERSAMEGITERLAALDGLYFPGSIRSGTLDSSQRKTALFDLLVRDVPIFLERYGGELTVDELASFEVLRSDYEVGWHLSRLRRHLFPTEADSRAQSSIVRNRRRAYMERLIHAGEYFSEDAMREREPFLHHQYLGRFQDPSGRVLSRPGEKWSETLMRRCDEAIIVEKIRGEQERLGLPRSEWVGGREQEEEEEEKLAEEKSEVDEDEPGRMEENGSSISPKGSEDESEDDQIAHGTGEPHKLVLSAEEMHDQLDQFTCVMQQKFLSGEDTEHLDYSQIDNDDRLDDYWLKEANHDAEEKYFDQD